MRPDLTAATMTLALLITTSGVFGANNPPRPPAAPPPQTANPISEALCGRASTERDLAEALGPPSSTAFPEIWRKTSVETIDRWLEAAPCTRFTEDEHVRFQQRHNRLEELRAALVRAIVLDGVEAALLSLKKQQPKGDGWANAETWPAAADCPGCAVLRRAALVATRLPDDWVRAAGKAADEEALITKLCAARPFPKADDEIKKRFAYYTWTPDGAWLLAVARWYEQPAIAAGCDRK
jgi:hypothetical protein